MRRNSTLCNADGGCGEFAHQVENSEVEAEVGGRGLACGDEAGVGFEFSAVDSHHARSSGQGGDFLGRVDFKEGFHAEFQCELVEAVHGRGIEHICHEQNRIRTERTGFVNLIVVHKKILAQNRVGDLFADFAEAVDVHSEVRLIREDGNRPHD